MITLRAYTYNIKLAEPIAISFHRWLYQENILVYLDAFNQTGVGEAAPFKPITGDSQEEVIRILSTLKTLPFNPSVDTLENVHTYLNTFSHAQTANAAIDFAYHDLQARLQHVPVWKLYTQTPHLVPNSVTVFIKDTLEETAQEARRIYTKYPDLKILKIKLKGEHDKERAEAIKKVSPAHMQFIVDANQGFVDPQLAVKELTTIKHILGKIILIEEPCPKGELEKLKYVTDHVTDMLVFADESAATYEDAKKVVTANAAHGINIKLQKAGGIWPGKQIAKLCEEKNLPIMVGSMLDGPVATMASLHFAVSTKHVLLSDLDMDLEIPEHATGIAPFVGGRRIPNNTPGFGITISGKNITNEDITITQI